MSAKLIDQSLAQEIAEKLNATYDPEVALEIASAWSNAEIREEVENWQSIAKGDSKLTADAPDQLTMLKVCLDPKVRAAFPQAEKYDDTWEENWEAVRSFMHFS